MVLLCTRRSSRLGSWSCGLSSSMQGAWSWSPWRTRWHRLPRPIRVTDRLHICFDEAVAIIRRVVSVAKDVRNDVVKLLVRLIGNRQQILAPVWREFVHLIAPQDILLNLFLRLRAAADKLVIVVHAEPEIDLHHLGWLWVCRPWRWREHGVLSPCRL